MKVRKVSYKKNGKTHTSAKFYAHFADHQGIRRRLALFEDLENSNEMARAIQRLVSLRASDNVIPSELLRLISHTFPYFRENLAKWDIIDSTLNCGTEMIRDQVVEWGLTLSKDGNGDDYVKMKVSRVQRLFAGAEIYRWSDIAPGKVRDTLSDFRDPQRESVEGDDDTRPISVATSNHYLQAAKQFCSWMVSEKNRALTSPIAELRPLDSTKTSHERRALEVDEVHMLLTYLQTAPVSFGITAEHRKLIYLFAIETGIRFEKIRTLTRKRIELHDGGPAVFVPKENAIKSSMDRWVPLSADLMAVLDPHIQSLGETDPVFTMPTRGHGAKMLKRDLDGAREAWIAQAASESDRAKREASDFLRYIDSDGRYVDFHALRHTRGVWLFKHYKASPRDVQDLMGVGSLQLVDRYSRSYKPNHGKLANAGPKLNTSKRTTDNAFSAASLDVPNGSLEQKNASSLSTGLSIGGEDTRLMTNLGGRDDERTSANADELRVSKTNDFSRVLTSSAESGRVLG